MGVLFSWKNPGGGSFSKASNWHQDPGNGVVGAPGPSDSAVFNVGGSYTVTLGGQTVQALNASDDVTFTGSITSHDGIGGDNLVLEAGTFTVDPDSQVSADGDLLITGATIVGGSVAGAGVTATGSSFRLSGGFSGVVKLAADTVRADQLIAGGSQSISGSHITLSTDAASDSGTAFITGANFKIWNTTLTAERLDLIGTVTWSTGTINVHEVTSGMDRDGAGRLTFTGTMIHSQSAHDDGEHQSPDPTVFNLVGAHWANTKEFSTSGTVALSGGATLTTGSFIADPTRGSGAVVRVNGGTLVSHGDFQALSLTLAGGGEVRAADAATFFNDSLVQNAELLIGGDLNGSGFASLTIGSGGTVSLGGSDDNVPIIFKAGGVGENLLLGKGAVVKASVSGFHAGDAIQIGGLDAQATMTAKASGSNTTLTFTDHGEAVAHVTLAGRFAASALHFDAATHSVTAAAAIAGTARADHLAGTVGVDAINGGAGNDILSGNAGADRLSGGVGNDHLDGGAGRDALTGGAGADTFVFDARVVAANADTIRDFSEAQHDQIALDHALFAGIGGAGALASADFVADATGTARTKAQHIVYDTKTGVLSYDADGSGQGHAVAFATLTGHPHLVAADFIVS